MEKKLKKIIEQYTKVSMDLMTPEVVNNREKYIELSKKLAELESVRNLAIEYFKVCEDLDGVLELINEGDNEMKEMALLEAEELKMNKKELEEKIKSALIPADPFDKKNVIVEIRAGAGGDEAALFAAELMRMYMRYAEKNGWKIELMNKNGNDIGGIKDASFGIQGTSVYGNMKYESGVHRVQRIPETESQGRVHTSTATVAILPEAEEIDIKINDADLRIDIFRSSGPGGQSVNTTDSAVRLTHVPTGLIVICQDEKSQLKNKNKAMSVLRSRLLAMEEEKKQKEESEKRLAQIGTGDRSEKIRTYNFPQDRVTDHRIKINWSNIPRIMDGELDDIIEKMKVEDQASRMVK